MTVFTNSNLVAASEFYYTNDSHEIFDTEAFGKIEIVAVKARNPRIRFFNRSVYVDIDLMGLKHKDAVDFFSGTIALPKQENEVYVLFNCVDERRQASVKQQVRDGKLAARLLVNKKDKLVVVKGISNGCSKT